jgi:hypothetical protein
MALHCILSWRTHAHVVNNGPHTYNRRNWCGLEFRLGSQYIRVSIQVAAYCSLDGPQQPNSTHAALWCHE